MNRDAEQTPGRVVADLDRLREFSTVCQATAADLEALTRQAGSRLLGLAGPSGCAESFRKVYEAAGEQVLSQLRETAAALLADGQGLDRVTAALEEVDAMSAGAVREAMTR